MRAARTLRARAGCGERRFADERMQCRSRRCPEHRERWQLCPLLGIVGVLRSPGGNAAMESMVRKVRSLYKGTLPMFSIV